MRCSCFLVALFLLDAGVLASPTAEVSYVRGKVFALRSGHETPIPSGYVLREGDGVKTGPHSIAILTLNEGSKVKINENTVMMAHQLDEGAAQGGFVDLSLESGSAFSKVTPRKNNKFRVRTRVATMGVRGTEFFTGLSESNPPALWMCVKKGEVEVEAEDRRQSVVVRGGQGIQKGSNEAISEPRSYPWTRQLNWNMEPHHGSVMNALSLESIYMDLLKRDYD